MHALINDSNIEIYITLQCIRYSKTIPCVASVALIEHIYSTLKSNICF